MTVYSLSHSSHRTRPSVRGIFAGLFKMDALRRERLELANLSDEQLKDIGITPDQAQIEASRPSWDLPTNRF